MFWLSGIEPDMYKKNVSGIPFSILGQAGIRFYIIDLDNTISLNGVLDRRAVEALGRAVKEGNIDGLVILTNTIYGRKKIERAEGFARELNGLINLPVKAICLDFFHRKPKPYGFTKALEEFGCDKKEVAVVGDQLVSDIKGGNNVGIFTILVDPLGPYSWRYILPLRALKNRLAHRGLKLQHS